MSKLIEEQVVKMQFDNKGFESGVKESMSTLDKLKAALHFKDVNLTPLEKAFSQAEATATRAGFHIQDVWLKMSEVFEYQIARKIVNTGEKIAKSLTIEGAVDGFKEYELKMGSIQTIMAGTGESLETVNKYLEELNVYSDKTIYSFKDMTDNIGKFTNAGVKLDDAVAAIKGIANEAAVSGANANEASRAMYNFSQALSAGYVKLIDWKSIENANMATVEFKNTLLQVAEGLGTVKKNADGTYDSLTVNAQGKASEAFNSMKNFNDSLQAQWMNTEVLTTALKIYATDVRDLTEAEKKAYEQELLNMGMSEEQIQAFEQLGIKAANSATEIKTFTMLMDTLKEGIGSGWATTWQLIIGDFEEAKELWTSVGNVLGDVINKFSDMRNSVLEGGLSNGWDKFTKGFLGTGIPAADAFRNKLTEAAVAQGLLTEKEAENLDTKSKWIEYLREKGWMTEEFLREQMGEYYNYLTGLDKESREALNVEDSDLEEFSQTIGTVNLSLDVLTERFKEINELGGRENIIVGLKNIFEGISEILQQIGKAWTNVFTRFSAEDLKDLTVRFKEFSEKLHLTEGALKSIETVFTLVFQGIKIAITVVTTAIKGVSKLVLPVINVFDALLGVIGELVYAITNSDGIQGFSDKLNKGGKKIKKGYLNVMQKIADTINEIADAIRNWKDSKMFKTISTWSKKAKDDLSAFWDEFTRMPVIVEIMADMDEVSQKVSAHFETLGEKLSDLYERARGYISFEKLNEILSKVYKMFKDFVQVVKDTKDGIKNFFIELKNGVSIGDAFKNNFSGVIEFFDNLKTSLVDFFKKVFNKGSASDFRELASSIHEFITTLDADKITAIALTTVFGLFAINLLRLTNAVSDTVTAIGGTFNTLKTVINSYMKKQKSVLLQIAEAIVIVAAALYVLSTIPANQMDIALKALYSISACIAVLIIVLTAATKIANSGMDDNAKLSRFSETTYSLIALAGTLTIAIIALKQLSTLTIDKTIIPKLALTLSVLVALAGIATFMAKVKVSEGSVLKTTVSIVAVAGACYVVAEALAKVAEIAKDPSKLEKATESMIKMMAGLALVVLSAGTIGSFSALGLLTVVILFEKLMPRVEGIINYDYTRINEGLDKNEEIIKKIGSMAGAFVILGGLFGKGFNKMGGGLLKLIAAMGLLALIARYANSLKYTELNKGLMFVEALTKLVDQMMVAMSTYALASKLDKGQKSTLGLSTFVGIALTLGTMALIAKSAKDLTIGEIFKEIAFVGALITLVDTMFLAASLATKGDGTSFKSLALVLAGVAFILGLMVTLSLIKDKKSLIASMATIALVLGSLSLVFGSISKINSKASSLKSKGLISKSSSGVANGPILGALVTIGAVLAAMYYISKNNSWQSILSAGAGMTLALLSVSLLIKSLSSLGETSKGIKKEDIGTIVTAVVGLAAVTVAIGLLSKFGGDAEKMLAASGAISAGLLAFAKCIRTLKAVADMEELKTDLGAAATLLLEAVGALIAVSLAIVGISNFGGDAKSILASGSALALSLIGISVAITALAFAGNIAMTSNPVTMGEVIIGAIGALHVAGEELKRLASANIDSNKLIDAALSISVTTIAVGVASILMGVAASICRSANWKTSAAVIGGAILGLADVAASLLVLGKNLTPSEADTLVNLSPMIEDMMLSLSAMIAALTFAGLVSKFVKPEAMAEGIGVILGYIALIGVIFGELSVAAGDIVEHFPSADIQNKLYVGLDIMGAIFEKLGSIVGKTAGNLLQGLNESAILGLGDILSSLMDEEHLGGFLRKLEGVSKDAIEGAKNLSEIIAFFSGGMLVNLAANVATFGFDINTDIFRTMGEAVVNFVKGLNRLSKDDIDRAKVGSEAIKTIVSIMADITGDNIFAILGRQIKGAIIGDGDVEHFARQTESLGKSLVKFINSMKGLNESDLSKVDLAVEVIYRLSDAANILQRYGGLRGFILGDKETIAHFGADINAFATSIYQACIKISKLQDGWSDKIIELVSVIEPLNELANKLSNRGGIWQLIAGKKDLGSFGATLYPLAEGLIELQNKLDEGFNGNLLSTMVNDMYQPVDSLITLLTKLNQLNYGGMVGVVYFGKMDFKKFGKELEDIGDAIRKFCKDNDKVDYAPLVNMLPALDSLTSLVNIARQLEGVSLKGLKVAFKSLADLELDTLVKTFSKDTNVQLALESLFNRLINMVNGRQVNDAMQFESYGKAIGTGVIRGVQSTSSSTEMAITSVYNNVNRAGSSYFRAERFKPLGSNVSIGLANGIISAMPYVMSATTQLANLVLRNTQRGLREKSPSKESYKYGAYWDIGLADGISENTGVVVESTKGLTDEVIDSTNTVLNAMTEAMDSDMDYQPTIRPVVDTSDISEKAKEINSLLGEDSLNYAYNTSRSFNTNDLALLRSVSSSFAYNNAAANNTEVPKTNVTTNNSGAQNNDTTPVNVFVELTGDAGDIFRVVKVENDRQVKTTGSSPLVAYA